MNILRLQIQHYTNQLAKETNQMVKDLNQLSPASSPSEQVSNYGSFKLTPYKFPIALHFHNGVRTLHMYWIYKRNYFSASGSIVTRCRSKARTDTATVKNWRQKSHLGHLQALSNGWISVQSPKLKMSHTQYLEITCLHTFGFWIFIFCCWIFIFEFEYSCLN